MKRKTARLCAGLSPIALMGIAIPASAPVSVSSTDASQGGFGMAVFRVPTESDSASTPRERSRWPWRRWLWHCDRIDDVPNVILRVSLLALLCVALAAGPASAHAALAGSDPEDGASLTTLPSSITFTFNENIGNPAYVAVTAPDGTNVEVSDVSAVDSVVSATLEPAGQKGRYTASYRVVSTDGHPVEGSVLWTTTTGRTVSQVDPPAERGFVHRHRSHLVWGVLAASVAIVLLLAPLRRRDDENNA